MTGVRKAIQDKQIALTHLFQAILECRKLAELKPLTLQGSDYAHAVHELKRRLIERKGFGDDGLLK